MSAASHIEWTDRVWNPTTGCSAISPGCANCFAVREARRLAGNPNPKIATAYAETVERLGNGRIGWTGKLNVLEDRLLQPLSWRKPRRVFVNSMSDLFHEAVPDAFIDNVFAVMALSSHELTYQVLTKRAERMRAYLAAPERHAAIVAAMDMPDWLPAGRRFPRVPDNWPMPNVWLGVSCENQQTADERIPLLLQTPAAVRFISAEPLLGPVDLSGYIPKAKGWKWSGGVECRHGFDACPRCDANPAYGIDWVIVGGESGPRSRPFDLAWGRSIVQQCKAAGVPVFVKQIGYGQPSALAHFGLREFPESGFPISRLIRDRKGGDPSEWPEDLRVREFPQ